MAAPPITTPASMTGPPPAPATMTGPTTSASASTTAAPPRTFASILTAAPTPALSSKSFADLDEQSLGLSKKIGQFKGEKALFLSKEEFEDYPSSLSHALVGTFKRGRPRLEDIRKSFPTIGLKGTYHVAHYDHNHILVRLQHEEDFLRLLIKDTWYLAGFPLFFSKWHPDFDFTKDSSLVPIWVNFERLPLSLFGKKNLFSVASLVGRPLKVDEATAALTRPSVAKVCIEVDIAAPLPHRIWIGIEDRGFWQSVQYEDLPQYCLDCSRLGHATGDCKKAATLSKPSSSTKKDQLGTSTSNPKRATASQRPQSVPMTALAPKAANQPEIAAVPNSDHPVVNKASHDQLGSPSRKEQPTNQPPSLTPQETLQQPPSLTPTQQPSLTSKQPTSLTSQQPQSLTSNQPTSLTLTPTHPPSLISKQPTPLTSQQPQSLTSNQPTSLTSTQPPSLTSKQPPFLTSKQPPSLTPEETLQQPPSLTTDEPLEQPLTAAFSTHAPASSVPTWKTVQRATTQMKTPLGHLPAETQRKSSIRGPYRILSNKAQLNQTTDVAAPKTSHIGFPHPLAHDLILPSKLIVDPTLIHKLCPPKRGMEITMDYYSDSETTKQRANPPLCLEALKKDAARFTRIFTHPSLSSSDPSCPNLTMSLLPRLQHRPPSNRFIPLCIDD